MKIENICIVQSGEKKDPAVASFLKIVREKIEITCNSNSLPKAEVTTENSTNHNHTEISIWNTEHELKFSHHLKQVSYFICVYTKHFLVYEIVFESYSNTACCITLW